MGFRVQGKKRSRTEVRRGFLTPQSEIHASSYYNMLLFVTSAYLRSFPNLRGCRTRFQAFLFRRRFRLTGRSFGLFRQTSAVASGQNRGNNQKNRKDPNHYPFHECSPSFSFSHSHRPPSRDTVPLMNALPLYRFTAKKKMDFAEIGRNV